jgi:membrane peptidoglycan carboxypeptidase
LVGALIAAGVLIAGVALPYVGGLGLVARHQASKFLDTACNLQETPPPQKTTLLARDGKTVLATLFIQDRVPVGLDQIPQYLQDALIATEDRRFYSHHGVDMRGLLRSAVSTSSGDTQGGSTLTMQYVKQMRLYQAGKNLDKQRAAIAQTLDRKIEDAKCAIYIENTLGESKDEILDNYLNIAFFGENSYGIQIAAETYFNKPAKDLTLPESALLVGVLRAPTEYDPFIHPDAAMKRRNEVLQNLVSVGKLSQADADKYKATPVSLATDSPPIVREGCPNANRAIKNAAFFCDYVKSWLEHQGGITPQQLETGGLKIVTTLDAKLQSQVQQNLFLAIPATSPMTAVLPVVDPRSGDVLAMATSKHYGTNTKPGDNTHTSLPVFTSYTAQGASTYKLFPLLEALSIGVPPSWPLATPPNNQPYRPRSCLTPSETTNGDARTTYNANETLTSATVKSSNTYFVALADQLLECDLQPIVDLAEKLGIKGLEQPSDEPKMTIGQTIVNNQRAQQLVLGDVETSPLEIAGAYAAIANDGVFNAPAPVLSITDAHGRSIPVKRPAAEQVISPWAARQAVQILGGDTKFPGTSASEFQSWYATNRSVVAGKTGTMVAVDARGQATDKNAAIWFVGMTPDMVAASALINFDQPNAPSDQLPGMSAPGTAYGDYASGIWLKALGPSLGQSQWTWPDPQQVPGIPVPNVVGRDLSTAEQMLTAAGFTVKQLGEEQRLRCPSTQPTDRIAYYGPQIAPQGSEITICPSLGVSQSVAYVPPPRPTPTAGSTPGRGSGSATPPSSRPSSGTSSRGYGRGGGRGNGGG